jgi:membrane fusion protein (multidrug efflux system)
MTKGAKPMKSFKTLLLSALLLAAAGGLYLWWSHQAAFPSTDDATLRADILIIVPQVSGRAESVTAVENGYVKTGDVLFTLDRSALQAAVDTAPAQLELARLSTEALTSEVAAAQATVTSAAAALRQAEAEAETETETETETEADLARSTALVKAGDVAQVALGQAQTTRDQAASAKAGADAALAAAKDQAGAGRAPGVKAAQGLLDQAELALSHATITAPASGWVAKLRLLPGQVVAEGQPPFLDRRGWEVVDRCQLQGNRSGPHRPRRAHPCCRHCVGLGCDPFDLGQPAF